MVHVTDAAKLGLITDVVHDLWFDVTKVVFDATSRRVRVPIEPDWVLEVAKVDSCDLQESEGVGLYDINELLFSRDPRTLKITTGIPLTFRIGVSQLDVALFKDESGQ